MSKLISTIIVGAVLLAASVPAAGQQSSTLCEARDKVLSHLAKKYKEIPLALGVTSKGGLVEVLTSSGGATWTIIVSMPNGKSCLVAAGEGWRMVPFVPNDPEA